MTSFFYTSITSTLIGASLLGRTIAYYYYSGNNEIEIPYINLSLTSSLSSLAYMTPDELCQKANDCNIKFNDNKNIIYIDDVICDCQAYMWQQNNHIFLVFRGTDDIMDVLVDLDVRTEPMIINGTSVNIHQGFYRQFFSVESKIEQNINNMTNNGANELIITGHSLGGALASISNYYYSKKFPSLNITTYTYGSPRVGDTIFANDECHKNGYRIFNYYDPVPMFPVSGRFEHVNAKPLCIVDSGIFIDPPIYTQMGKHDINPFLRILMLFRLTPLCGAYHKVERYCDSIIKLSQ